MKREIWSYLIGPCIWIGLSYWLDKICKKKIGKPRIRSKIRWWALNMGVLTVMSYILAGIVQGFGRSPQAMSISMVLLNCWCWIPTLIGKEYIREYWVHTFTKGRQGIRVILIIVVMTGINISMGLLGSIGTLKELGIWSMSRLLPELCENILATSLVLYGGAGASICYLLVVKGCEWVSPILPDIDWFMRSILGISLPLLMGMVIHKWYLIESKQIKRHRVKVESIAELVFKNSLFVVVVWFMIGVFSIYPSVVISGSMSPEIKVGDMILVKRIKEIDQIEELMEGDIIQFEQADRLVSHRIVEIQGESAHSIYYTKGDDNRVVDSEPVQVGQIRGRVIGSIPKAGWLSILVRKGLGLSK